MEGEGGQTSLSPPGLTQTKASSSTLPVSVVGRVPKPVPMTLHQSPQASCSVGSTPLRARSHGISKRRRLCAARRLQVSVMK